VLRQIANQSARSAVATASRKDVRKQVIVKMIASVLALGSGVAALLLEVSTEFGLVVLGIGMLFSSVLALTIFRNLKQLRDLRRAAAALAGQSDEDGMEDVTAAK
jgi:predicted RND superfamily exporter protein